jgi:AAA15 family ATPase/GTPase
MLDHILIRNFKSIREARIDLQSVNLLIGPNNSGKSNFLEAFVFLKEFILNDRNVYYNEFLKYYIKSKDRRSNILAPFQIKLFQHNTEKSHEYSLEIFPNLRNNKMPIFQFQGVSDQHHFISLRGSTFKKVEKIYSDYQVACSEIDSNFTESILNETELKEFCEKESKRINFIKLKNIYKHPRDTNAGGFLRNSIDFQPFDTEIVDLCEKTKIYKIDPEKIKNNYELNTDKFVYDDASNLVSFLDNIRDIEPDIIEKINIDIRKCIPEFKELRFEKISLEKGRIGKRVGLIDKNKNIYWADELSEGTIYFLALLSIIHQPSPPSLLLLEEPEKGIHPRRIHEVIDYIFELSNNKNIQVIMTTHSPQVVDEFNDIPEAVHVFEMENGITTIKNLQKDIIDEAHKKSREKKLPEINFSKSLGEHWSLGFLGGVPK